MTTRSMARSWLVLAATIGLAAAAVAQKTGPPGAQVAESLDHWQYSEAVERGAADAPWYDIVLHPPVFEGARLDLADLRVYDASGKETPYAIRVLRPQSESQAIAASEFNRVAGPGGSREVSLDTGESPVEHNEVEIVTPGINFRRPVQVDGSNDALEWRPLVEEDHVFRFRVNDRELKRDRVGYSGSRFRYLRVRVHRDEVVDDETVELQDVRVRRTVEVPGETLTLQGGLGPREPMPGDGGPGSGWVIALGGDTVPVERVVAHIADAEFVRNYRIEAAGPLGSDQPFRQIARGEWRRRAGEKIAPMQAPFQEVTASRLRLVITDHRNPPLNLERVEFAAPVRQVVIANDASLSWPLRLYFGNPRAQAPNYDFARQLPPKLEPPPVRLTPGPREANPDFKPDLPLTERHPWLIYVVLVCASGGLAVLIVQVGRTAIRLHDAEAALTSAPAGPPTAQA